MAATGPQPESNSVLQTVRSALHTLQHKAKTSKYRFGLLAIFGLFVVPVAAFAAQSSSPSAPASNIHTNTKDETNQKTPQPEPQLSPTETNAEATIENDGSSSTHITVNGQHIPVPADGTSKQRVESQDGSGAVDVTVEHNSSNTSTSSSSYTNLEVKSSTERSANESS